LLSYIGYLGIYDFWLIEKNPVLAE
jgi:hypothetical protein